MLTPQKLIIHLGGQNTILKLTVTDNGNGFDCNDKKGVRNN